jgi:hypothetical protein
MAPPEYDVFLSYARQDASRARPFVEAFEAEGWKVFWDVDSIPAGAAFHRFINRALESSASVVVLWSRQAIESQWVDEEALYAKKRRILVPVLLERLADDQIPFGVRSIQAADLTAWNGSPTDRDFVRFKTAVAQMIARNRPPPPPPPEPTPPPPAIAPKPVTSPDEALAPSLSGPGATSLPTSSTRRNVTVGAGILALTVAFALWRSSESRTRSEQSSEEKVAQAVKWYGDTIRLVGLDMVNLAQDQASEADVRAIFERSDGTARRQTAFDACEAIAASLAKEGRKPDMVMVLDAAGRVVARDLNPNAEYGEDYRAKFPAVATVLRGRPVSDVWTLYGRMTQVALAPIIRADKVLGALLLTRAVGARYAQEVARKLGTEVVFFHASKVHSSSFVAPGTSDREDVSATQAVAEALFGGGSLAEQALSARKPTPVVRMTIDSRLYALAAMPLTGTFADTTSGMAVLAPLEPMGPRAR